MEAEALSFPGVEGRARQRAWSGVQEGSAGPPLGGPLKKDVTGWKEARWE